MDAFKLKLIIGLFALLIGISPFNAYSQQYNLGTVVPPSPNAASLGKFGGITPGLHSGMANVDIPLTSFKARKLTLPISLSYASSGLKVDEMASRVGAGWNLDAGGVITRTVFGSMDEFTTRARPTNSEFEMLSDRNKVNYLNRVTGQSEGVFRAEPLIGEDSQPDIFNFNVDGHTGQFIIKYLSSYPSGDPHFECVALNHSALKIETGLRTSDPLLGYVFKISTEEGIQYLFNRQETTVQNYDGACGGVNNNVEVPTAYYLTRVIHPNKDTINLIYDDRTLHYTSGVVQSIYHIDPNNPAQPCFQDPGNPGYPAYPNFIDNTCVSTVKVNSVILKEINATSGGKILFNYVNRTDYDDQLLAGVAIYQPGQNTVMKQFVLNYLYANNRPFLLNVTEKDVNNVSGQKYEFAYNNLERVPAHLSYAQDHWGYFNGKANTTMIPASSDPYMEYYFPQANADREPDPEYSKAGMLSSVKYPTGGKDSIIYEGNTTYSYKTTYPNGTSINVTGNGTAWPNTTNSPAATISYKQVVYFTANCDDNTVDPDDPEIYVRLINTTTQTGGYEWRMNYNESVSERLLLDPGTYRIEISIYGNATVHAEMSYRDGSPVTQQMNFNIGGLRVAKTMTYDPVANVSAVKKYNYSLFNNPGIVSSSAPLYERYGEAITVYGECKISSGGGGCSSWLTKGYLVMRSNTLFNLYAAGSPVAYVNVTEIIGENAENGMVQHQYTSTPDVEGTVRLGIAVPGTPFSSSELMNGKELYTGIFKKNGAGFLPVKKTYTHYIEDTRRDSTITGFSASRNFDFNCPEVMLGDPTPDEWNAYNLMIYDIYRKWIYPDTVRTQTFDAAGLNYTEQVQVSEYNNPFYPLITKDKQLDSKGNWIINTYTYPFDYTTFPYTAMRNIFLLPVIEQSVYKNAAFLSASKTNYADWGNNIYMPETVQSKIGAGNYDTRLHYYSYDDYGNLTCASQENGPKISYLYSYAGQSPIAEIKNADYISVKSVLGAENIAAFSKLFPDKTAVDNFLAPLFPGLPAAMISKIVYRPSIGVSSITDPKGMTTYYEYDNFQRLMNIKDKDGKIIKHTDYHYQGQ